MIRLLALILFFGALVSGCYQATSDVDLRAIPTTNNPNIIPRDSGAMVSQFS